MKNVNKLQIVIPIRIDTPERFRNLELVLHSLSAMGVSVTVLEADKHSYCSDLVSSFKCEYRFVADNDEVFYRTHYLNELICMCNAPVVGVWDSDIIVSESQIEQSLNAILSGKCIMSSPYNGHFFYLTAKQSIAYAADPDYSFLNACCPADVSYRHRASWGGAFLVHKELYMQCGGENEHFYGWGPEDIERVHRLEILGHVVHRVKNKPLYHLWHPRGLNSSLSDAQRTTKNRLELVRICSMTRSELETEVKTWN